MRGESDRRGGLGIRLYIGCPVFLHYKTCYFEAKTTEFYPLGGTEYFQELRNGLAKLSLDPKLLLKAILYCFRN